MDPTSIAAQGKPRSVILEQAKTFATIGGTDDPGVISEPFVNPTTLLSVSKTRAPPSWGAALRQPGMLTIADSGLEHFAPRKDEQKIVFGDAPSYDRRRDGNDARRSKPIRRKTRDAPHAVQSEIKPYTTTPLETMLA